MDKLCRQHREPFIIYCHGEKCELPLCNTCLADHRGHEIYNTISFGEYLNMVVKEEMKLYSNTWPQIQQIAESIKRIPDKMVQEATKHVKNIQNLISSIERTMIEYTKMIEERANDIKISQSKARITMEKIIKEWGGRDKKYVDLIAIIEESQKKNDFAGLLNIWLYLKDETSMEMLEEQTKTQYFAEMYDEEQNTDTEAIAATSQLSKILEEMKQWKWVDNTCNAFSKLKTEYKNIEKAFGKDTDINQEFEEAKASSPKKLAVTETNTPQHQKNNIKSEDKYKCGKCREPGALYMLLSCELHQLCTKCAPLLIREKVWCVGGLDIDNRVDCEECGTITVVDTIHLANCKCVIKTKALRAKKKLAYDYGRWSLNWPKCDSGDNLTQEEIFYIWGPAAYSYFDDSLTSEQLNTTLQKSPLTEIWISKKKSKSEFEDICNLVGGSATMEKVAIRNQGTTDPENIYIFKSFIERSQKMSHLDLKGNALREKGWGFLSETIMTKYELQGIDLGGNNIGDAGALSLASFITKMAKLQWLALSNNNIGDEGIGEIAEAIGMTGSIQFLDLKGNFIGLVGARSIGKAMEKSKSIKGLSLADNNVGDEGIKMISESIQRVKCLEILLLNRSNIRTEGIRYISQAIEKAKCIKMLNLDANEINDTGAGYLAEGMKIGRCLRNLSLQKNHITDKGAKTLAEAIMKSKSLRSFNIKNNEIGGEGAMAIVDVVQKLKGLKSLSLTNDGISGAIREIATSRLENIVYFLGI